MSVPRPASRPDRSPAGQTRAAAARELADYADVRDFFRVRQHNRHTIDPGRLIEATFLGAAPEEDVEAVLIAWLTLLPSDADVSEAASDLSRHLCGLQPPPHSAIQRRLLDLLAFVAAHRRAGGPGISSHQ